MRFESRLSRMNCQTLSTGLSSGDFGGSGTNVMFWDGKLRRDVPSGLIEKNERVSARRDCKRDFLMEGHGLGVAGAFSGGRTDCAEHIRPDSSSDRVIVRRRRPGPTRHPSAGDLVFLPGPGFVLKPNLYRFAASLLGRNFLHDGREIFLNASAASSSRA